MRAERDIGTLRALLNLSASTLMASYLALLVLLAAGIGAAFLGHWWAFGWPWAALGVLIAIWLSMRVYPSLEGDLVTTIALNPRS